MSRARSRNERRPVVGAASTQSCHAMSSEPVSLGLAIFGAPLRLVLEICSRGGRTLSTISLFNLQLIETQFFLSNVETVRSMASFSSRTAPLSTTGSSLGPPCERAKASRGRLSPKSCLPISSLVCKAARGVSLPIRELLAPVSHGRVQVS